MDKPAEQQAFEPGFHSEHSDEDWSQVKATITMLTLAVAQIRCGLTDGDHNVGNLTQAFTHISDQLNQIESVAKEDVPVYQCAQEALSMVQQAVTSFQFYDRLTQRLDHVSDSLNQVNDLLSDEQRLHDPVNWQAIQGEIKENYSMDCERLMFEQIMRGASVESALELYQHKFTKADGYQDNSGDEIELF